MPYPENGIFPDWVWTAMTDLGLLVAFVALLSAIMWLWKRGPQFFIDNGPDWMTRLGHWWSGRREK